MGIFSSKKPEVQTADQASNLVNSPHDPQHSFQLKIKLISLSDEAKTIRRIEQKLKHAEKRFVHLRDIRENINEHRRGPVGSESRSTNLAYGFLKGRPYKTIEPKRHTDPDWKAIERMVKTYGSDQAALMRDFEIWKVEAGKPDPR